MFPSPNRDDPFEFLFQKQSFLCDESPSSKQDTNPSPYFNFASPFFHEHELPLSQIFSQKRRMPIEDTILIEKQAEEPIPNAQFRRRNIGAVPRKRNGKKDRHSKICTAHGVRDRRMRLSLQVARKFFDLQDMLGYDKASKTIDWLFSKSSTAIKELIKDHPQAKYILTSDAKSESFLSECEVVSEENSNNEVVREGNALTDIMPFCTNPCEKDDIKSVAHACNKPNTRATRIQARTRARYRTREGMMIDRPEIISSKSNPNSKDELQKLGLSSNVPFKGVDQESGPIIKEKISTCESDHYPSSVVQQTCDVGTIEKLLLGSSNSSSTSAASGCVDTNSNYVRFLGNWDLFDNYQAGSSPTQMSYIFSYTPQMNATCQNYKLEKRRCNSFV